MYGIHFDMNITSVFILNHLQTGCVNRIRQLFRLTFDLHRKAWYILPWQRHSDGILRQGNLRELLRKLNVNVYTKRNFAIANAALPYHWLFQIANQSNTLRRNTARSSISM